MYNQSIVLTHSLMKLMEMEESPLSQVRINKGGVVEISSPRALGERNADGIPSGGYTWESPDWINLTSFQARGTAHAGVFEKYLLYVEQLFSLQSVVLCT